MVTTLQLDWRGSKWGSNTIAPLIGAVGTPLGEAVPFPTWILEERILVLRLTGFMEKANYTTVGGQGG
jgi:hypothetical protein